VRASLAADADAGRPTRTAQSSAIGAQPQSQHVKPGTPFVETTTEASATAAWRDAIYELSEFPRPSASEGERRAAEWIAARLRALGCESAVEQERAHGGYWWPLGLANLLALAAGLLVRRDGVGRARRALAVLASGTAAAALWDDLGHGRRWFRRALLPKRATWNVLAYAGDPDARRTVVLIAHHDAAHSGLVFHPALGQLAPRYLPRLHERSSRTLPVLYGVWLGPVAICLGALARARGLVRAGSALALGALAAMVDIGERGVVPGANDNLAAVGVLLAIAERLRAEPLPGVRVLLLSTGSEESFSEGMQAFGERHFPELDRDTTEFICLECLGGPTLIVLEGEGMLRMRTYPQATRDALANAAAAEGVSVTRGLRTVAACDALIALRAGYPVATLASIDATKLPLNYHWPSDTPAALHWRTIEDAIAVCERLLRERSDGARG
jgi:acetylornithine deacetylase/succinyl-diaminopimelate desuccinylase-like protein